MRFSFLNNIKGYSVALAKDEVEQGSLYLGKSLWVFFLTNLQVFFANFSENFLQE